MVIVSKQNPVVKELASLREKKGRRERGTFLVEGDKMFRECAKSGMQIVRVALLATEERLASIGSSLGESLGSAAPVLLGEDAFKAVSDEKTPQGVIAEVRIPDAPPSPPEGRCLLLDGVSDPANVGAVIRTAAAAGYREIYFADCADPYSPKSVRASMSGVFYCKLMRGTREEMLAALGGVPLIAADMDGADAFAFVPPEKHCICIGNEGNGLSDAVRGRADCTVGIPMQAPMESLNAAVSAAILMYLLGHAKK